MPGVPVLNPWAYCEGCRAPVDSRSRGHNTPCGCAAPIGSDCPTWEPGVGCSCAHERLWLPAEVEAAQSLQEALEEQERMIAAAGPGGGWCAPTHREAFGYDDPNAVPEVDKLLDTARRLKPYLSWAIFIVALLVLAALWTPGF